VLLPKSCWIEVGKTLFCGDRENPLFSLLGNDQVERNPFIWIFQSLWLLFEKVSCTYMFVCLCVLYSSFHCSGTSMAEYEVHFEEYTWLVGHKTVISYILLVYFWCSKNFIRLKNYRMLQIRFMVSVSRHFSKN
jgi:hypothetical protein